METSEQATARTLDELGSQFPDGAVITELQLRLIPRDAPRGVLLHTRRGGRRRALHNTDDAQTTRSSMHEFMDRTTMKAVEDHLRVGLDRSAAETLVVLDPTDTAQQERAHTAYGEIMELAIRLGETIT